MYMMIKVDDKYTSESRELYGRECTVSSMWNDGILIPGNVVELRLYLDTDKDNNEEM